MKPLSLLKRVVQQLHEADIIRCNSSGLTIYNPKTASEHLKSMKNKTVTREAKILARREYENAQSINYTVY